MKQGENDLVVRVTDDNDVPDDVYKNGETYEINDEEILFIRDSDGDIIHVYARGRWIEFWYAASVEEEEEEELSFGYEDESLLRVSEFMKEA